MIPKYGSIAWQDKMIKEINRKAANNIELDAFEKVFLKTQAEHTSDILEGYEDILCSRQ